ncbi:MAG: response regulator, partial [Bacteroidota bacterium]
MSRKYTNKVFVVEDDTVFGKVLQRSLERTDDSLDVRIFQSGRELFDNLHLNPDIVSLDYNLPDMNGLEILKKIQQYSPEISTVILSGQEEVEVVVEAYKNGANQYIIKNENALVELSNVVKNLSSHVNLKKEVEELRAQIADRNKYSSVVGDSNGIMKVLRMI